MSETTVSALTEHQAAYVAGLVELAGWLSNNPDAIPQYHGERTINRPLQTNGAVEVFAARHDLDVFYDDWGNASTDVTFGGISFHFYGYADPDGNRDRIYRRFAEEYAAEHDLALVPADGSERS